MAKRERPSKLTGIVRGSGRLRSDEEVFEALRRQVVPLYPEDKQPGKASDDPPISPSPDDADKK